MGYMGIYGVAVKGVVFKQFVWEKIKRFGIE